ncbi:hypothetical protein HPB50_026180 [Hyalomma asiaticum]|uniref:Uncharacterized protein n=1 Tax=Hyalomma asiaticum TaxID=266040 RepID=A0ACB7RN08_HYAAI|nr:hypothetical protein HPB50_026180 [Hyalomma asiaticum]
MAQDKALAIDGSRDGGIGVTVVYVFGGFLFTWVVVKLVLAIMSYAEASVRALAASLLEARTRTAKELFEMNFELPFRGLKDLVGNGAYGEDKPKQHVHSRDSAEVQSKGKTFGRPVRRDDHSSDDSLDEDEQSDGESTLDGLSNVVKAVLDAFAENLKDSNPALDRRATSLLFGELLGACDQLSATTFADVLDRTNARDIVKMNQGKHSDVFRVGAPGGAVVLKVLHVEHIGRYAKQLCNHLHIARALCVWDGYPRELSDACRQFAAVRRDAASRNVDHIIDYRQVPQPYLVLQMDYAGVPLSSVQVISVFRQVVLTLAVAEAALNFEHRHLSLDNVYVTRTQRERIEWKIGGKRADWSSHCPRTNVLFTYHVTRELAERFAASHLRSSREEAEEWDEFQTWKFKLPWFPSVAEFARDAFASAEASPKTPPSSLVAKMGQFVTRSLSSLMGGDR